MPRVSWLSAALLLGLNGQTILVLDQGAAAVKLQYSGHVWSGTVLTARFPVHGVWLLKAAKDGHVSVAADWGCPNFIRTMKQAGGSELIYI